MEKISKIQFDKNFVERLLEKLKIWNSRTIHLNAIPGRSLTRLDLSDLSIISTKKHEHKTLSQDFLDNIFDSESFSFEISYDENQLNNIDNLEKNKFFLLSKKLNTLVIENDDNFLEYWIKNFWLGFPILIKADKDDPTKIIKAPLFIWDLDIERSFSKKNTWIIRKEEDYPIKLNELLISYLSKDESIKLEKISKEILEDWILDRNEFLKITKNILSQININSEDISINLEKCPDKQTIESDMTSTYIQWSGVFGIYRSQKEAIINWTQELLDGIEGFQSEDLFLKDFQKYKISPVQTDPSKKEIINSLTRDEIKLIQWPPWTWKSQSISAIVSNALSNDVRCLIVCEKKTALDVIQSNLEKIGLGYFSVVIDDVNRDRKQVIKKARDIVDNKDKIKYSQNIFDTKYNKFLNLKNELNAKYKEALKKVFGDFSWKELIGFYLELSKTERFEEIIKKLDYNFFKFNYEEYSKYLEFIEKASYLYQPLNKDLENIFSKINAKNFRKQYNINIYEWLRYELDSFLDILNEVNSLFSQKKTFLFFYIIKNLLKINKLKHFNWIFPAISIWFNNSKLEKYCISLLDEINNLKENLHQYESLHNWKYFEIDNNSKIEKYLLSFFKTIPPIDWINIFKAWYYRWSLINFESNSKSWFNNSDTKLNQLNSILQRLKKEQINQIKYIWKKRRDNSTSILKYNFNALYNLRKNKIFARRNSLRKIVETDFDLFTTLFPVVLTNPTVVNSIFPLKQWLFEIVIFDEASQLRISDTFTSLIRGQYKIIAWDEHQMPPSSYFQSNSEVLDNQEDEDTFTKENEQMILAESESLLEYAQDLKIINKSYLDFHYRSKHPALIQFSNHAFYWWNLIPFPPQKDYKPIEFRAINWVYKNNTNPEEINEIINILQNEIDLNEKGKYPSIGIATFNINQRNLIIETFNKVAEQDSSFSHKLQKLKEEWLFVKNLENVQWDQRDIIIISTTYGVKSDGKFSQNFARINRVEWYKLLNVLITRAKIKLYVCTSIPKQKYIWYDQLIKTEWNNRKGILYAYLSYAEAISNHDIEASEMILKSLKEQSFDNPRLISENSWNLDLPFEEQIYNELLDHFDRDRIIQYYKIGGFELDFLIETETKSIILECDGKSYHQSNEAYSYDLYRQKELENMWYKVYRIWSRNWFQNKKYEIQKLLEFIESLEK